MTARARLSSRRASITFDFESNGLKYTATASFFPNGDLAEIFLSNTKPSSQSDANARDSAIAASLALQFGCPVAVLRKALLRDAHGRPSTPLARALDLLTADGEATP